MKSDKNYDSNLAETIEASGEIIRNSNPVLICFIITTLALCAILYFQFTTTKDQIGSLITELKILNSNIEKQNYIIERFLDYKKTK